MSLHLPPPETPRLHPTPQAAGTYAITLEVSGFVFSCGDQLSFEKIEDGVIKGTVLPFTIDMLNKAFSVLPSPNQSTEKKATAVR